MASKEEEQETSRKPADSRFKQQQLAAWKPILTPRTVLPTFGVIGLAFLITGAILLAETLKVKEWMYDYSDCVSTPGSGGGAACKDLLSSYDNGYTNTSDLSQRCICEVNLSIDPGFDDEHVFMYYALKNYHQNHRWYVKSRWDPQLRSSQAAAGPDCDPIRSPNNGKAYYAPCGLIANSLFNDTIQLFKCTGSPCSSTLNSNPVTLDGASIAWPSDKDVKFRNPDHPANNLCQAPAFLNGQRPPNWPVDACELGTNTAGYNPWSPAFGSSGQGYENEDFIVWMRTAALPNFRKLYRHLWGFSDGTYVLKIGFNYPVDAFDGTKTVVLSTTSSTGGRNVFLGVAYLVVGCLCLVITAVFAFLVIKHRRVPGDTSQLTW